MKKELLLIVFVILACRIQLLSSDYNFTECPNHFIYDSLNNIRPALIGMNEDQTFLVTLVGSYHIWENYHGFGIDASYFNDIPIYPDSFQFWQRYVDSIFSNPIPLNSKDSFRILNPFTLTDTITIKPCNFFSFRLNNNPLDDSKIRIKNVNKDEHILQFLVTGHKGDSLSFDMTNSYELNSIVHNAEITGGRLDLCMAPYKEGVAICDVLPLFDSLGVLYAFQIDLSLITKDENTLSGIRNILKNNDNPNIFSLLLNNHFYCPEVFCDNTSYDSLAIGIVIDVSGTMMTNLKDEEKLKLNAAIESAKTLINRLSNNDLAFIFTFSDIVKYDQFWTKDKQILLNAIDYIESAENPTSNVYNAILNGLDYLKNNSYTAYKKGLIFISDCVQTNDTESYFNSVYSTIKKHYGELPIIFIMFPAKDSVDTVAHERIDTLISINPGSAKFIIKSSSQLDSVFVNFTQDMTQPFCCNLTVHNFQVDSCNDDDSIKIKLLYTPIGKDSIAIYELKFPCKDLISCITVPDWNAGLVKNGLCDSTDLTVTNNCSDPIVISKIIAPEPPFSISKNLLNKPLNIAIQPGEKRSIGKIYYCPAAEISSINDIGKIIVCSNAKSGDSIAALSGKTDLYCDCDYKTLKIKGGTENIRIVKANPYSNQIFATSSNILYLSEDNGDDWLIVGLSDNDEIIKDVLFDNKDNILISTTKDLYLSSDGGYHFYKSGFGRPSHCSYISNNRDYFAFSYENGLYKSTDKGQSWSNLKNGLQSVSTISSITEIDGALILTANNGIYKSTDEGSTFQLVNDKILNLSKLVKSGNNIVGIFAGSPSICIINASFDKDSIIIVDTSLVVLNDIIALPNGMVYATGFSKLENNILTGSKIYLSCLEGLSWKLIIDTEDEISNLDYKHGSFEPICSVDSGYVLLYALSTGIYEGSCECFLSDIKPFYDDPGNNELSLSPNPLENDELIVNFEVINPGYVTLELYPISGSVLSTIHESYYLPGSYSESFNFKSLASGTYFIRYTCNKQSVIKKFIRIH
jgi:hypothetical protein